MRKEQDYQHTTEPETEEEISLTNNNRAVIAVTEQNNSYQNPVHRFADDLLSKMLSEWDKYLYRAINQSPNRYTAVIAAL